MSNDKLTRRDLMNSAILATVALTAPSSSAAVPPPNPAPPFDLDECTIDDLRQSMSSGRLTSLSITRKYLDRIAALDHRGPALHHIIELNPDALATAASLDRDRKAGRIRGPLHGIPILLKDNIDTADRTHTTAGSLALSGNIARNDAFLVRKLREAGAVILAKANLSEWANFRSEHSSSGWSGLGGQARNPYALDRTPSGSSSGSAGGVAANYCAAAVGTETDGSIVSPSSCCGVVGIKPTVGLISRSGVIPISHTQDTAGPIARTVTDAAILLGVMAGPDPSDPATQPAASQAHPDYTRFLKKDGLKGARLGIARSSTFGFGPAVGPILASALAVLKSQGTTLIDPLELPTPAQIGDSEYQVMLYEFKAGLNKYLQRLSAQSPIHSLADLIKFNDQHCSQEMPFFGQEIFLKAQEKGPLDSPPYLEALAKCRELSRAKGIDAATERHKLDAIISITAGPPTLIDLINGDYSAGGSSTLAAIAGYPSITVPAGQIAGLPIGLSFTGPAFTEPILLRLAYAFEQATRVRRPPTFAPAANLTAADLAQ